MDKLNMILTMIDHSLNTQRKRHVTGGILFSMSLLFGGLAITVISLKLESDEGEILEKEKE